jgi:hypothetical protein
MEPAGKRRDDDAGRDDHLHPRQAAMEPAAGRRDDVVDGPGKLVDRPAAMEPAGKRRDDTAPDVTCMQKVALPQWSPPVSGKTAARISRRSK